MSLVRDIESDTQSRLAKLSWSASAVEVATLLGNPHTPLVVVCDSQGVAIGVITRTDIVKLFSCKQADAFAENAGGLMTQPVIGCRADETLEAVWQSLNDRGVRCAPVLDKDGRPHGIVHARDVVRALLDEVVHEEVLLRDYVLGVGYR
jgi:CBS domain-containing protein